MEGNTFWVGLIRGRGLIRRKHFLGGAYSREGLIGRRRVGLIRERGPYWKEKLFGWGFEGGGFIGRRGLIRVITVVQSIPYVQ